MQLAYCVMVEMLAEWDIRAVRLLRECLILVVLVHSCSTLTARMSKCWQNAAFAQYGFCVSVSFWLFWDIRAVRLLRACRNAGGMRPSRRLRTALWSLAVDYRTFVQLAYCVMVSFVHSRHTKQELAPQ